MVSPSGTGSGYAGDLRSPVSLERLAQIDRQIGTRFFDANGILTVKLFNRDGRLVYSDDRTIIGGHAFRGGNVYTALARNLGLRVVAEGVETAEIMRVLADLRCDIAQSYFISRPQPAAELDLQALSVSFRGPARKPSSSSASS